MLALNHAATATIIALTVKEPAIAIPLALGSHFVLDAIPHYSSREQFGFNTFKYYIPIAIDLTLTLLATIAAFHIWPAHHWLLVACVVAATGPDYFWPLNLTKTGHRLLRRFFAFHQGIQRSETTRGIFVELAWLAGALTILSRLPR